MRKGIKILSVFLAVVMLLGVSGCAMSRKLTQEEKDALTLGTITDGVYENAYFGIGFQAEADWTVDDYSKILELNGWKDNGDLKAQAIKDMAKPGYFYEMNAMRNDQLVSVNVCVENVAIYDQPDVSEDGYVASAIITQQEIFKESPATNVVFTTVCENLAGQDHYGYLVTCQVNGEPMYYRAMYIKVGIYAAVITITSAGEDLTDEAMQMFYQL